MLKKIDLLGRAQSSNALALASLTTNQLADHPTYEAITNGWKRLAALADLPGWFPPHPEREDLMIQADAILKASLASGKFDYTSTASKVFQTLVTGIELYDEIARAEPNRHREQYQAEQESKEAQPFADAFAAAVAEHLRAGTASA